MTAYLVANPPARSQFRSPRRELPSGVGVVHTAENAPDVDGSDSGAENVAAFIQRRSDPGSYHDLVDADSIVNLVPYDAEAYQDATGSNPHAYAVSAATRAAAWGDMPPEWRDATVRNMARAAANYAAWLKANYGIDIPARRISRAESDAQIPGFISHAERDPANRSDPGAEFPWDQFLTHFAALTGEVDPAPQTPENDMPPAPDSCVDSVGRLWVVARGDDRAIWAKVGESVWFTLDGVSLSGPTIAAFPDGSMAVTAVGEDQAVWRKDMAADGVWSGWYSVGGRVA